MNIRLGIYEIFSRILPGGVYIAAIIQLAVILGLVTFDMNSINNLSFMSSLGLVVVAYILGGVFDGLAYTLFKLFNKPGYSARTFAEFKLKNKHRWIIDFEDGDWQIVLAFIRTKNLELASELERNNALSVMLRNVSLGLLFMAINSLIQFFISWSPLFALLCIILLIVSIVIVREAVKFRGWFYNSIYETIIAYRIDLENTIRPVKSRKEK